jgi:hypothetical protein
VWALRHFEGDTVFLPVSALVLQRVALMCDNLKTFMEMENSQNMLTQSFCLLRQFQCKLPSVRDAIAILVLLMMSFP